MDDKELIEWLKDKGLFDTVNNNFQYFQKIFKDCLGVKKEEVLIIGDLGASGKRIPALMLGCYLLAAKRLNLSYKLIVQEPKLKGEYASDELVTALEHFSHGSIMVFVLSNRIGSIKSLTKSYRRFAKENMHRFVSTTSLSKLSTSQFNEILSSINIDYEQMRKRGSRIKEILDNSSEVTMITDKGTNLTFDIKMRKAINNAAEYTMPGFGGNIPAGEVYIAPNKGINGVAVIDGVSRTKDESLLIRDPIKMKIEEGEITKIEGREEAQKLLETLEWAAQKSKNPLGTKRIGELGIGINPGAVITNSTILSEKALGTAHISIGSNYWFGGNIYSIIHLDQVIKNPKFWVDRKPLNI